MRKAALRMLAATVLTLGSVAALQADSYPSRPLKIVVPFPAGGPLDVVGRALADRMAASVKQPVVIENRAGAGGSLGADAVAKAAPDGYTLLLVLSSTLTVNPSIYRKLPYDPVKDLRLISIVSKSSQVLAVHPSLPAQTVSQFVDQAKQEPIAYAHAGPGSPGHLLMEYFRLYAGFKATPVPYRGNALLVTDLVAGQIKAGFIGSGGLFQHLRDGRLRALAISTPERSPLLPEVPTIAESGYPEVRFSGYFVLAAPAGTPDAIAARIEDETRQALQAPEVREKLRAIDIEITTTSAAEADATLAAEAEVMARVTKAAGMQVD